MRLTYIRGYSYDPLNGLSQEIRDYYVVTPVNFPFRDEILMTGVDESILLEQNSLYFDSGAFLCLEASNVGGTWNYQLGSSFVVPSFAIVEIHEISGNEYQKPTYLRGYAYDPLSGLTQTIADFYALSLVDTPFNQNLLMIGSEEAISAERNPEFFSSSSYSCLSANNSSGRDIS